MTAQRENVRKGYRGFNILVQTMSPTIYIPLVLIWDYAIQILVSVNAIQHFMAKLVNTWLVGEVLSRLVMATAGA